MNTTNLGTVSTLIMILAITEDILTDEQHLQVLDFILEKIIETKELKNQLIQADALEFVDGEAEFDIKNSIRFFIKYFIANQENQDIESEINAKLKKDISFGDLLLSLK